MAHPTDMTTADDKEESDIAAAAPNPTQSSAAKAAETPTAEDVPPKESKKPATTSEQSSEDFCKSLSLHDCLALGEIELGLANQRQPSQANDHLRATQEIQRLPYILRLLSSTRPLASISMMDWLEKNSSSDDNDNHPSDKDALVDTVVDGLEDVAATYSIAEAV